MFVPVLLELDAPAKLPAFWLHDYLRQHDEAWWPEMLDAWVRARIPPLFEFTPARCVNNVIKLFNVAFVAVVSFERRRQMKLYPFACSVAFHPDDDLEEEPLVGLYFSRRSPSRRVKARIADRFWSLLQEESHVLEPFLDTISGDGYTHIVGYDGRTFLSDTVFHEMGEDDPAERYYAYLMGPLCWCEDCEGTGIEPVFPYLEDCPTCAGTGTVTW